MDKEKPIGIVLAGGNGSRLSQITNGKPKHLLKIPSNSKDEEPMCFRILKEMVKVCSKILCIIKKGDIEHFLHEKDKHNELKNVHFIEKEETGEPFKDEFKLILDNIKGITEDNIILTVGDIIFPEKEIFNFIKKTGKNSKSILGFSLTNFNHLNFPKSISLNMSIAKISVSILKKIINVNPESFLDVSRTLIPLIFSNRLKIKFVPILFNVNYPETYKLALEYLKKYNSLS